MRIAISGTHCAGKSTLIEEFVLAFPEYVDEPEAYEALEDVFPEPTSESFFEQLEYHVDRLKQYNPGDCVNDSLNMFGAASPKIVRASGDVAQRLEILNSNLNANTKETFG